MTIHFGHLNHFKFVTDPLKKLEKGYVYDGETDAENKNIRKYREGEITEGSGELRGTLKKWDYTENREKELPGDTLSYQVTGKKREEYLLLIFKIADLKGASHKQAKILQLPIIVWSTPLGDNPVTAQLHFRNGSDLSSLLKEKFSTSFSDADEDLANLKRMLRDKKGLTVDNLLQEAKKIYIEQFDSDFPPTSLALVPQGHWNQPFSPKPLPYEQEVIQRLHEEKGLLEVDNTSLARKLETQRQARITHVGRLFQENQELEEKVAALQKQLAQRETDIETLSNTVKEQGDKLKTAAQSIETLTQDLENARKNRWNPLKTI